MHTRQQSCDQTPRSAVTTKKRTAARIPLSPKSHTPSVNIPNDLCAEPSAISKGISACKHASYLLQSLGDDTKAMCQTAENAVICLQSPLRATAAELDQLVLEASKLRKASAARIMAIVNGKTEQIAKDEPQHRLMTACIQGVLEVAQFISRYIQLKYKRKDHVARLSQKCRHQPLPLLAITKQCLKSTFAVIQVNLVHDFIGWNLCTAAMDSCLVIFDHLVVITDEETGRGTPPKENIEPVRLKVSNLYWSHYLRQKENGAQASSLLSVLARSIEALLDCPLEDKLAGFLPVKCERAASLYMENRQFEKVSQILKIALDALTQNGTCAIVAEAARSQSFQSCWGKAGSQQYMLGRLLSMFARQVSYQTNGSSLNLFYDPTTLLLEQRALVLERQLITCIESSAPQWARSYLNEIAGIVMSCYESEDWSLRRLRVKLKLLIFCTRNSTDPCTFFPGISWYELRERDDEVAATDEGGQRSIHKAARLAIHVQWSFHIGNPSFDLLRDYVTCCTHLSGTEQTWSDDQELVLAQIRSIIDFSDMHGFAQLRLDALSLLQSLLQSQSGTDTAALSSCISQIGQQLTRMGLTQRAGQVLALAETLLGRSTSSTFVAIQWHLAYSEYLTAISNCGKAEAQLSLAQLQYERDFQSDLEDGSHSNRLAQRKYLAQAALVASRLALKKSDLDTALLHGKRSVKISFRQWAILEKLLSPKSPQSSGNTQNSGVEELTKDLGNMSLALTEQGSKSILHGAAFWPHIYLHYEGLLHVSHLSARRGSFQDAIYYVEQALKIGEALQSDLLQCSAAGLSALYFAQAKDGEGSRAALERAQSCPTSMSSPVELLRTSINLARAQLALDKPDQVIEMLKRAETALSEAQADELTGQAPATIECREQYAKSRKETRSARTGMKASTAAHSSHYAPADPKSGVVDVRSSSRTPATKDLSTINSIIPFQHYRVKLYLLWSSLHTRLGHHKEAKERLDQIKSSDRTSNNDIWYCVRRGRAMLEEAARLLQTDAVYSIISESIIACPVSSRRQITTDRTQKTVTTRKGDAPTRKHPISGRKLATTSSGGQAKLSKVEGLLQQAQNHLLPFLAQKHRLQDSGATYEYSDLQTRLDLLADIFLQGTQSASFRIATHLDAPKSFRWARERACVKADLVLSSKPFVFTWPKTDEAWKGASLTHNQIEENDSTLQQLISDLPPSWTVATVTLSSDQAEMILCKLRSGQSPFSLRLPLQRTSAEILDDMPLEFKVANEELLDIIAKANLSAHDTKDRSDRQGKKEWWAARQTLDDRLKTLLNSMETLWLGGFRGMLSSGRPNHDQLARFSASLLRTLECHLPSRHHSKTKNGRERIQLNSHVLELFIALGNPDGSELDELIMDLLYFVVDILQFQGELNAYDEIDFDVMVVEVMDALRGYHDHISTPLPGKEEERGHTILILDNALHAFPWESLPCLQGQSVSRMPSLECLDDRLQRLKRQKQKAGSSNSPCGSNTLVGLYIDATSNHGAYILNPSSDLTSTQATFLPCFQTHLPSYTSIINRVPSESEFESCLREHNLCLYFGHGSGGQFIRGRRIKRLAADGDCDCAVTFLMGCSSSKLSECGWQFEPHGMPFNYLQAGSPAVVGTLWDVTDKDIDRFAMQTFVNWGLFGIDRDGGECVVAREGGKNTTMGDDTKRRKKPKSNTGSKNQMTAKTPGKEGINRNHDQIIDVNPNLEGTDDTGDQSSSPLLSTLSPLSQAPPPIGLDTAVSQSRNACVLRYLNGAAPVIYGIPVYLEKENRR